MIEYNLFYARRFAYLLEQLDSIPEGDGTVLDHTAVVWISELGTGAHDLHDPPVVIGGGGGAGLRTGQYLRYARSSTIAAGWGHTTQVGPSQNQLYVTLMRMMEPGTCLFILRTRNLPCGNSAGIGGTKSSRTAP